MQKKLILISTPTSATGSLWRIVQELCGKDLKACHVIDSYLNKGVEFNDIANKPLPDDADVYLFNQPHLFNFNQDLSNCKFIVNFRDPRDLSCNQYYWIFEHPVAPEMEEQAKLTRQRVRELGISKYCENNDLNFFYESFYRLFSLVSEDRIHVVSYAQMCLMSDHVITTVANFINSPLDQSEIQKIKEREFPSSLQENPGWVSGKWAGADLLPGRARIDLDYETYRKLSSRYARVLNFMAQHDLPQMAGLYDH